MTCPTCNKSVRDPILWRPIGCECPEELNED